MATDVVSDYPVLSKTNAISKLTTLFSDAFFQGYAQAKRDTSGTFSKSAVDAAQLRQPAIENSKEISRLLRIHDVQVRLIEHVDMMLRSNNLTAKDTLQIAREAIELFREAAKRD